MDIKARLEFVSVLRAQVAEPYPTALLIRERALVVNFEAVRMIICRDQCFVSAYFLPYCGLLSC